MTVFTLHNNTIQKIVGMSKFMPEKAVLDEEKQVLITASQTKNLVSLEFKSPSIYARLNIVPENIKGEGRCAVNIKDFTNTISRFSAPTISITDTYLSIKEKGRRFKLPMYSHEGIKFTEPQVSTIVLNTKEFVSDLRRVSMAASKDAFMMTTNAVLFEAMDGYLHLVATDTQRIAISELQLKEVVNLYYVLALSDVKSLIYFLNDIEDELKLHYGGKWIGFSTQAEDYSIVIWVNTINKDFPDYTKVLPDDEPQLVFSVNKNEFIEVLKDVLITGAVDVELQVSKTDLIVSAVDNGKEFLASLQAETEGNLSEPIIVNAQHLLSHLRTLKGDKVWFELGESRVQMLVTYAEEDSITILLISKIRAMV